MNARLFARFVPAMVVAGLVVAAQGIPSQAAARVGTRTYRVIHRDGSQQFPSNSRGGGGAESSPAQARVPFATISHSPRPSANAPVRSPLNVPVVTPRRVDETGSSRVSFQGIDLYQERYVADNGNQFSFTPPDQGLCAGNGFVVESVNDAIRVFTDTGAPASDVVSLNQFFGYPSSFTRPDGPYGPELTDPSCYFDAQYQRWVVDALTLQTHPNNGNLTLKNKIDLAVSETADPTGTWDFYRMWVTDDGSHGTPTHKDCPCLGDYPHIGADRYGFYVTTNEYPWSGTTTGIFHNDFNGAQIYAMSKKDLLSTAPSITVVQFSHLTLGDGTPSFTVWPAEVPGLAYDTSGEGTEYFLQTTAASETNNPYQGMSNTIGVWKLTNSQSLETSLRPTPHLRDAVVGSEIYGVPPQSEQKVGPVPLRDCLLVECIAGVGPAKSEVEGPIDSGDSRMLQTWLVNGRVYGAFSTIVNVGGRYQAGVAWVSVNPGADLPAASIEHQGYVAIRGNLHYPAIATLGSGEGVMAVSVSGARYYPSAGYVRFGPAGPSGEVEITGLGESPLDDFCEYRYFGCASPGIARPRYGDYGAAVWDGGRIWIANEYVAQSCTVDEYESDFTCGGTRGLFSNWSTHISQVRP